MFARRNVHTHSPIWYKNPDECRLHPKKKKGYGNQIEWDPGQGRPGPCRKTALGSLQIQQENANDEKLKHGGKKKGYTIKV